MKFAIMINYRNMLVGGIENNIIQMIKQAKKEGISIIWLSDINPNISPIYQGTLNDENITRIECNTHGLKWFSHKKINLDQYERVVIISFNAFDHFRAIELANGYNNKIRPIFITPHFTGGLMFPEDNFVILNSVVKKLMRLSYKQWIDANEMFYFAPNHPDAIEKKYGIEVPLEKRKRALLFNTREPFDKNRIKKNYNRKQFIIVSAGRIDFPHKGFLIGLIDAFMYLKREFPDLCLYIVGEGPSFVELKSKLESLPDNVKSSITTFPFMPTDELVGLYKQCNLNISVAGCATLGARNGLITLPARHYTYNCEVYGFFPRSKDMTTSTDPGEPVEQYIRQVLNMSESEYIQKSEEAYYSFIDNQNSSLTEYFTDNHKTLTMRSEIFIFKIFYYIDKIRFKFANGRK